MSNSIEEILEDAYRMGVNDTTLKVNDHDVLMPKMKVKAKALITEARVDELIKIGDKDKEGNKLFTLDDDNRVISVENRIKSLKKKQGSL